MGQLKLSFPQSELVQPFIISISSSKAPVGTAKQLLPQFLSTLSLDLATNAETQLNGCYKGGNVKVHAMKSSGEVFGLAEAAKTV